ncbi:MAG: hypothetical protein ACRDI1_00470 [Actinomycetota bacterium]
MNQRSWWIRIAVVLTVALLQPMAGGALADQGGEPRTPPTPTKPAAASNAEPKDDSKSKSDSPQAQEKGPDHSDTSNCDGDPSGKSDKGKGANQGEVYDNTCPNGDSQNGEGGGKAVGIPCAGCVGQADDKNPPGQMPSADEDGNNGYECDENNGIAKTNPAHTGCQPPEPTIEPTDLSATVKPECDPAGTEPGAIVVSVAGAPDGATVIVKIDGDSFAGAGSHPAAAGSHDVSVIVDGETIKTATVKVGECSEPTAPPVPLRNPPEDFVQVLGVQYSAVAGAGALLPMTGMNASVMFFLALVMAVIGTMAMRLERRRVSAG